MLRHTSAEAKADLQEILDNPQLETVLPSEARLNEGKSSLPVGLPPDGWGLEKTLQHLKQDIVPALNAGSLSPNYYGFVTGGVAPAAEIADHLVTAYDQNVQVHLPNETIATEVEDRALVMLRELLDLDPKEWQHRTFTTGATASNIVGLGSGREYVITKAAARNSKPGSVSVGDWGVAQAMRRAGVDTIQILTTVPHSSLYKAASILGIGRLSFKDISTAGGNSTIDVGKLETALQTPATASIVAISCSEVNTGHFATESLQHMQKVRELCDAFGAWIHVDGAFGILGRVLDPTQYPSIAESCAGLELADSIAGDGHKLLNVPYDCGFVFTRSLRCAKQTFKNPNAAYLSSGDSSLVESPLNIGIENSRRFRALPVYANLIAYGKEGYRDMLERQVGLARAIARYIHDSEAYELLPQSTDSIEKTVDGIFIIVLLRAKDDALNQKLVQMIKQTSKIYVSGTVVKTGPACRFAISNWQVDIERDVKIIREVLDQIAADWQSAREKL